MSEETQWSPESMLEVSLKEPDDFLKVRETLTRIGVASRKDKKLFQSCHIIHKQGRYFIVHFKELFALDGKHSNLSENDIEVHAVHGVSNEDFFKHLNSVLDTNPDITMDDGADLVTLLLTDRADIPIMGSMEETTTGVIRLKSMEKNNKLRFPVVAVNDSETKHLFDNRFGTGQSAMDGVVRATDLLIAGLDVVVIGFGDCGKGVAERAYGMGAKVTVVEPNSVRALEALMHGYEVKSSVNASKIADVIVSVTGNMHALDKQHFDVMKDGVVLANAGHFDVEINLEALKQESAEIHRVRDHVESYLYDGKEILVLAEGRLVNLAAASGHPASVMDMSFANQALAAEWIKDNHEELLPKVYTLPNEVDLKIAATKLGLMGGELEILTKEQIDYLDSWEHGTS